MKVITNQQRRNEYGKMSISKFMNTWGACVPECCKTQVELPLMMVSKGMSQNWVWFNAGIIVSKDGEEIRVERISK